MSIIKEHKYDEKFKVYDQLLTRGGDAQYFEEFIDIL